MLNREQLITAYEYACAVELDAFKPGNVSVYAEGHDMTVADFRLSAQQSAPAVTNTAYSLGQRIYYAVKNTRAAVGCNTNLGIILLAVPLIMAAEKSDVVADLRKELAIILSTTTVEDADWVFRAITLAAPGGLGNVNEQNVAEKASVTLFEAMKIASAYDRIALQFTTNYKDIFDFLVFRYNEYFERWGNAGWSAVAVFSAMLAKYPDSHIERKHGNLHTRMVMDKMALVNDKLSEVSEINGFKHLEEYLRNVDSEFKSIGINPGTTADFTVATVLVFELKRLLV